MSATAEAAEGISIIIHLAGWSAIIMERATNHLLAIFIFNNAIRVAIE
jgi:hypothetical protein